MKKFEKRISKGRQLEQKVMDSLDAYGLPYLKTGYEFLDFSNNGMAKIKKRSDNTSFFVRHYPDLTIVGNKKSCLLEIKNSSGIERQCYNNYLELSQNLNLNVILVLRDTSFCLIEELRFEPTWSFDKIAQMHIPVSKEVWREPRLLDSFNYQLYLNAYAKAGKFTSGCSFAFIDFKNTKTYPLKTLKNLIA